MASQSDEKRQAPSSLPGGQSSHLGVTDGSDAPLTPSEGEEGKEENNTTDPPPHFPSNNNTSSLLLRINSPGAFSKTLQIRDSKDEIRYTCVLHSISRPHVIITAAATATDTAGEEVGHITFHPFSRTISVVVRNESLEIQHKGVFKSGYTFHSPTLGQKLEWKGRSTSVLVDEKGIALARLEMTRLLHWKEQLIEIVEPWAQEAEGGRRVVDEVVCTALAIREARRRRSRNSGGAGGAGGVGG